MNGRCVQPGFRPGFVRRGNAPHGTDSSAVAGVASFRGGHHIIKQAHPLIPDRGPAQATGPDRSGFSQEMVTQMSKKSISRKHRIALLATPLLVLGAGTLATMPAQAVPVHETAAVATKAGASTGHNVNQVWADSFNFHFLNTTSLNAGNAYVSYDLQGGHEAGGGHQGGFWVAPGQKVEGPRFDPDNSDETIYFTYTISWEDGNYAKFSGRYIFDTSNDKKPLLNYVGGSWDSTHYQPYTRWWQPNAFAGASTTGTISIGMNPRA